MLISFVYLLITIFNGKENPCAHKPGLCASRACAQGLCAVVPPSVNACARGLCAKGLCANAIRVVRFELHKGFCLCARGIFAPHKLFGLCGFLF